MEQEGLLDRYVQNLHCALRCIRGLEIKKVNFSGVKVMLIIIIEICFIHVLKKQLVRM